MATGLIDTMTGPYQRNLLPPHCAIAADCGTFTEKGPRPNWLGHDKWHRWLAQEIDRYGTDRFVFAVAPDVPFDAAATLDKSLPLLAEIRDLGIPAAFAAQNGCDTLAIPWDDLDALFLAGDTAWKIGPVAHQLTIQAKQLGKWVHMGRVNSRRRLGIAEWFGCDSADGTFLKKAPDFNLERIRRVWLEPMQAQPSLATAITWEATS